MLRMVRTLMLTCLPLAAYDPATAIDVGSRPAPDGEALCEDYELRVNGQLVPVYSCRVSAMPFNQVWPGYQRPVDQTELAGVTRKHGMRLLTAHGLTVASIACSRISS